jgi:replicative DNA helicase
VIDIGIIEAAIVGGALLEPERVESVIDLSPSDFSGRDLGDVWAVMVEAARRGAPADYATVCAAIPRLKDVASECYARAATAEHVESWARAIVSESHRRRTVAALQQSITRVLEAEDVDKAADDSAAALLDARPGGMKDAVRPMSDDLAAVFMECDATRKRGDGLAGISTGLPSVDAATCGLVPGQLILIGGTTGTGKSALALGMAVHAAKHGIGVYYSSMEMTRVQLGQRITSQSSNIDCRKIMRGQLSSQEWATFAASMNAAKEYARFIHLDARPALTSGQIRAAVRRASTRQTIGLIVVDYIQLMRAEKKHDRRDLEVASFAVDLAAIAKTFNCPVVAPAQLNRAANEAGAPGLHHLRESGGLEHTADTVLLIDNDTDTNNGVATIRVRKARMGSKQDVTVAWDGPRMRFREATTTTPNSSVYRDAERWGDK